MPSRLGLYLYWLLVSASLLCASPPLANAQDTALYEQQIKPLFAARCIACHGVLKQEAGLRLDTGHLARQGAASGPVLQTGDPEHSSLLQRVSASDPAERMPPEGEPLTAEQIKHLNDWIAAGAGSPSDERPEADPREHWAFQKIERPAAPVIPGHWGTNPMDAFIAQGHRQHGLQEPKPAGRRELIRRLYIDLLGLPPTAEQWNAALQDNEQGWYERLVDRLLDDPRYGERWGRHWMDVWRYSDWWGLGDQLRNSQLHMWHWRDWIVESLNQDLPYAEMIRLMLAADELAPTDQDKLRATGYLARNYFLFNRHQWMDETVEHVGKGILGLTTNCAKCHDHKYDPINQTDYYRMRAFFEPYHVRMDMLPGQSDLTRNGLPRVFESQTDSPTYLFIRGQESQPDKSSAIAPGVPEILALDALSIQPLDLPAAAWQPERQPFVAEAYQAAAQQKIDSAQQELAKAHKRHSEVRLSQSDTGLAPAEPTSAAAKAADFAPVVERFEKLDTQRWKPLDGDWAIEDGLFKQRRDGPTRSVLRLQAETPADFEATVKFTVLGGSMWRSVCLSFDATGESPNNSGPSDTLQTVYVSAVSGSSKLQGSISRNGNWEYPPEATVPRPIALNEAYTLRVVVRGTLINAYLNDEFLLAWQSPLPRRAGRVQLETFDALAAFHSFELKALDPATHLHTPSGQPKNPAADLEEAEHQVQLAERDLHLAKQELELVNLTLQAMRADWQLQDAGQAADAEKAQLQQQSIAAHQQAIRFARQLDVARAQRTLDGLEWSLEHAGPGKSRSNAGGGQRAALEKQVKSAKEALEKSQKAAEVELKESDKATTLAGAKWTATRFLNSGADDPPIAFGPKSSGRRTALARWITDRRNPLTARVAVNHIWTRHFGTSLVETPFDFGRKTPEPRQRLLLDWLAAELMESNWSMKHLHRVILKSQTYQMSSSLADCENNLAKDPDNHWWWRRNPIRIESQVVRDGVLALAGTLDLRQGGPPVMPGDQATSRRRSLYFFHSNNDRNLFLTTFDEAAVKECYRREQSIVPQQALALTNSQLVLDAAGPIAQNIVKSLPAAEKVDEREYVAQAFRVVLGIEPSEMEVDASLKAMQKWRASSDDSKRSPSELLVWALLNHNDFVTLR